MSGAFSVSSSSRNSGSGSGGGGGGNGIGNGSSSKPMYVVRFALDDELCEYHEVRRLDSYAKDEMKDIWFTKDEYKQMSQETKVIIDAMENYESKANNNKRSNKRSSNKNHQFYASSSICCGYYIRGLENKTQNGSVKKKMANLDGVCAVLVEQERQRREGMIITPQSDEGLNLISKAYKQVTAANVREAMERGGYDAQQVQRQYNTGESSSSSQQDVDGIDDKLSTPLARLWILAKASPGSSSSSTTTLQHNNRPTATTTTATTTTSASDKTDLASTFVAMKLSKSSSRQQQHQRGMTTATQPSQQSSQQFVGARERIRSFLGRTTRTVRRTSSSSNNPGRG